MQLWRDLRLSITPSDHLFVEHIIFQMRSIIGGLVDKTKDHIKQSHQEGMKLSRSYIGVTDFRQLQTSPVQL